MQTKLATFKEAAETYASKYPKSSESFMLYHSNTKIEDAFRLEIQTFSRVIDLLPEFQGVIDTD